MYHLLPVLPLPPTDRRQTIGRTAPQGKNTSAEHETLSGECQSIEPDSAYNNWHTGYTRLRGIARSTDKSDNLASGIGHGALLMLMFDLQQYDKACITNKVASLKYHERH